MELIIPLPNPVTCSFVKVFIILPSYFKAICFALAFGTLAVSYDSSLAMFLNFANPISTGPDHLLDLETEKRDGMGDFLGGGVESHVLLKPVKGDFHGRRQELGVRSQYG